MSAAVAKANAVALRELLRKHNAIRRGWVRNWLKEQKLIAKRLVSK